VAGKRTESQQKWFKARKAAVAAIRLKHTMRAEDEINEVIPALQKQYESSLKGGPKFELEPGDLLRDYA